MIISKEIVYIDSLEELSALSFLLDSLNSSDFVSMDTEFTRTKTYYPRFDLLQLNIKGISYILDPISFDLRNVIKSLNNTKALVLMFSGREDIDVLSRFSKLNGITPLLPQRIADVQLLAAFLNLSYTQGLQSSLKDYLDVEVAKSETLSDWEKRPLTASQILYASDDVAHLENLYKKYLSFIKKEDIRLAWFFEEMQECANHTLRVIDPKDIYLSISGAGSLTKVQLQRLAFLAYKREIYAREKDVALSRIIPNKCIVQVAVNTPLTFQALASCKVKWGAIRQQGSVVIEWVKESLTLDLNTTLKAPFDSVVNTKDGSDESRRLKHELLMAAQKAQIRSELLLQKSYIYDYLYAKHRGGKALIESGWRYECIGKIDFSKIKKP